MALGHHPSHSRAYWPSTSRFCTLPCSAEVILHLKGLTVDVTAGKLPKGHAYGAVCRPVPCMVPQSGKRAAQLVQAFIGNPL